MPSRTFTQPFAALEPRVRHVSAAAIRKKWKKLPLSSQDNIKEILSSLERQCVKTNQKKGPDMIVNECVQEVAERLIERLPRMPFPPFCDEQHFDFEATLHRVQAIEEQLTYNVHSMNLLRAQITKEERMLEDDRDELEKLERSLKSSHALRRQQEKTIHPIAQKLEVMSNTSAANHRSKPKEIILPQQRFATDMEDDTGLLPMLKQLRNHLESIENNTSGLRPLSMAMDEARQEIMMFSTQSTKIT